VRLNTYGLPDTELTDAVERLLADTELRTRLADIGSAIRARDGLRVGADAIERVVPSTERRLTDTIDTLETH